MYYLGVLIIWTFAIYGMYFFFIRLLNSMKLKERIDKGKFALALISDEKPENVEVLIRCFIKNIKICGNEEILDNMCIINLSEEPETKNIIELLARENNMILILDGNEITDLRQLLYK